MTLGKQHIRLPYLLARVATLVVGVDRADGQGMAKPQSRILRRAACGIDITRFELFADRQRTFNAATLLPPDAPYFCIVHDARLSASADTLGPFVEAGGWHKGPSFPQRASRRLL